MKHFGVNLRDTGKAFALTREEFAPINTKPSLPCFQELVKEGAYTDKSGGAYTEAWCQEYRQLCLKNFDRNMEYFSKLDKDEFESALTGFLSRYPKFVKVEDLNEYSGTEGYYLMVLDGYKQVYIGKTDNIKQRIMKHWSSTKAFDRTLLPMYAWETSCFSVDFFRALDTTRIYVWKRKQVTGLEAELTANFPNRFLTNRIGGDVNDPLLALATMNKR